MILFTLEEKKKKIHNLNKYNIGFRHEWGRINIRITKWEGTKKNGEMTATEDRTILVKESMIQVANPIMVQCINDC